MGRIRRLLQQDYAPVVSKIVVCPRCVREISRSQRDAQHLIPESTGGWYTEYLHRICHRQIHFSLSETELARQYSSVEALLAHPDIATFVAWVKTKPNDFMQRTRKSQRLKAS